MLGVDSEGWWGEDRAGGGGLKGPILGWTREWVRARWVSKINTRAKPVCFAAPGPHLLSLRVGNQDAFASFETMIWQLCRRDCCVAASCASWVHTCLAVAVALLLLAHVTPLGCHWARAGYHLPALTEGCNRPCIMSITMTIIIIIITVAVRIVLTM